MYVTWPRIESSYAEETVIYLCAMKRARCTASELCDVGRFDRIVAERDARDKPVENNYFLSLLRDTRFRFSFPVSDLSNKTSIISFDAIRIYSTNTE